MPTAYEILGVREVQRKLDPTSYDAILWPSGRLELLTHLERWEPWLRRAIVRRIAERMAQVHADQHEAREFTERMKTPEWRAYIERRRAKIMGDWKTPEAKDWPDARVLCFTTGYGI